MLDSSTLDRLRSLPAADGYVVSVYLGHAPDVDELRSIPGRLRALVDEVRDAANVEEGPAARILLKDLDDVVNMARDMKGDYGKGSAIFVSTPLGLSEHVALPAPVRDRLVVDTKPYLGPLQSVVDHFHRYAAVVVDRRGASLYRFHMGELQSWEEIAADEPIRKDNYGGFGGYAEQRVRGHAEAVVRRLFRTVAERITDLYRTGAFEVLAVGGNPASTASLLTELPAEIAGVLSGTFVVDVRTATPTDIRDHCRALAADFDRRIDQEAVADLLEAASPAGRAVLGLDAVIAAVNRGAIDRLLVAADSSEPGVACPACGAVDRDADRCPVCSAETRPIADLIDGIAERARATGAAVRYVLGDSAVRGPAVGAFLRYRLDG